MLREAVKNETPVGMEAKSFMDEVCRTRPQARDDDNISHSELHPAQSCFRTFVSKRNYLLGCKPDVGGTQAKQFTCSSLFVFLRRSIAKLLYEAKAVGF